MQLQANYTWSHTFDYAAFGTTAFTSGVNDPVCVPCNRANSFLSIPQVFIANFIYQTPSLAGWNGATKAALGGWQLSGIYRAQSGQPFTILSGQTTSFDNRGRDYPDWAGDDHAVKVNPGSLDHYLDASQFASAAPGTKGNVGRNPAGAYGPGVNTWDLGLSKSFKIRERFGIQFRWEMFNAFNRKTLDIDSLTKP